jgi:hypothetical protein
MNGLVSSPGSESTLAMRSEFLARSGPHVDSRSSIEHCASKSTSMRGIRQSGAWTVTGGEGVDIDDGTGGLMDSIFLSLGKENVGTYTAAIKNDTSTMPVYHTTAQRFRCMNMSKLTNTKLSLRGNRAQVLLCVLMTRHHALLHATSRIINYITRIHANS